MPSRNRDKIYKKGAFYHVYNRGVDKRKIYMDDQDYAVFLHLLKYYLSDQKDNNKKHPLSNTNVAVIRPRPIESLNQEINLLVFCLMPNHFHLLIKQITIDGMTKLIHKLLTIYSVYFNRRYNRVGHLFQGRYKAVIVNNDEQLLHLSRYIHLNPVDLGLRRSGLVKYPYSSLAYYFKIKKAQWVKPKKIFDCLNYPYEKFVFENTEESSKKIDKLFID